MRYFNHFVYYLAMERVYVSEIAENADGPMKLFGWIQDLRVLKNIVFIVLRDNTGVAQITVKRDIVDNFEEVSQYSRESVISVSGSFVKDSISKTGPEVLASEIILLNRADAPLPIGVTDPVKADLETRLTNRYLDLRKQEHSLIFRAESSLLWGIRAYLRSRKFVEVHSPKIVAAATEGGADLFSVKYFEKNAFLNQSPQLYKEILISAGLDRVFEVGPAFRAEKHNTVRHLNEFTSIDIEMGFADHRDAMEMLENSIDSGVKAVVEDVGELLKGHGYSLEIPKVPFPRVPFTKCLDIVTSEGLSIEEGQDLSPEHLRIIGEKYPGFYFITDWPADLRAFYTMPTPGNDRYSNSFDLQLREMEVTSGAQRIHDPAMLEKRFLSKGLNPKDFDFYISAFRYGMPPHAGWGLGLERLTTILLDLPNIREATLFPRDRTRISP